MTILLSAVCLLLCTANSPARDRQETGANSLVQFAVRSWAKAPLMRTEDAYKWLFHATLGGEHAVKDDDGPRKWLESEWQDLAVSKAKEPDFVALDPESRILRVNLRPYKARGGDQAMLLAVFVESARRFRADKSQFLAAWRSLGRQLRNKPIGKISFADWKRLDARCAKHGYPAIEHSEAYIRAYDPAYRVVLGALWGK